MRDQTSKIAESSLTIVKATPQDIPVIQRIVNAAYEKYVERIGRPPAPMLADWASLLTTHDVRVLRLTTASSSEVVGGVVLGIDLDADSVKINNLVVDPKMQGRGYGKVLMKFAEDTATELGRPALTLFTNALMYENLSLYPKLGFQEIERRSEDGYDRVFFRKELS